MTYPNHKNYNCQVTTESGESFLLSANWLNNNDLNRFQNWRCFTGVNRIVITENLDVYNAACQTKFLGNLNTNWELLNDPITCPNIKCTSNTDDLMTRRYNSGDDICGTAE